MPLPKRRLKIKTHKFSKVKRPLVRRSKKRATVKRRILNIKKRILSRFVKKGKHQQKIISTVANNATLYSWFIKNAFFLGALSTTALLAAIHSASASKKKTDSREASFERTSSSSPQNITDSEPLRRQPPPYHQELLQSNKRLQPVIASDKSQNKGLGSLTNELAAAIKERKPLRKVSIQPTVWEKKQIENAHRRFENLSSRQSTLLTEQAKEDISLIIEVCDQAYRSLIANDSIFLLHEYNELLDVLEGAVYKVVTNH